MSKNIVLCLAALLSVSKIYPAAARCVDAATVTSRPGGLFLEKLDVQNSEIWFRVRMSAYAKASPWTGLLTVRIDGGPTLSMPESVAKEKIVTLKLGNLTRGEHSIRMSMRYGEIDFYIERCIVVRTTSSTL
jgi:hypothetical protein